MLRDATSTDTPGVQASRDAHSAAESHLRKLRNDIDALKQTVKNDPAEYGRDAEFKALRNTCIRKDMGDYTYEFCFLTHTKQISNNDGFTFNLGCVGCCAMMLTHRRFDHFDVKRTHEPTDDAHYMTMLYDNGQVCWNGPPRSTEVTLQCGEKNELLHVFEGEKCVYEMIVATPAVCFPPPEARQDAVDEQEVRDEL